MKKNTDRVYTSSTGATFTDADVEAWGEDFESTGNLPGRPGPVTRAGRPLTVGDETAAPFSVRLDPARRAKVKQVAAERNTTPGQLLRDLIDTL